MPAKPPLSIRFVILVTCAGFASLAHNPVVRLEAELGLSPSPLEKLFGIRGFFSGMTEATVRLTRLDLFGAARANVLVFPTLLLATVGIVFWWAPTMRNRTNELVFFLLIGLGTIANNVVPSLLGG